MIKKDGLCPPQTCTCRDADEMTCVDDPCPELNCAADELEGRNDDECCNRCISGWVVVGFFSVSSFASSPEILDSAYV